MNIPYTNASIEEKNAEKKTEYVGIFYAFSVYLIREAS